MSQNELYIFMEYCSEGTLWTAAQQGGLTDYMIRHYTREILKAVDALHDRGVVHRDIKGKTIWSLKQLKPIVCMRYYFVN